MALKFFNTLSGRKEDFIPLKKGTVGMYNCGPTVYQRTHIGNLRAYVFADILRRTLLYFGFKVKNIINITDVDDKTIRDAQKDGKTLKEFTEFYTAEFFKDIEALNLLKADKYTKATDYIDQMVALIEKLLIKGHAYKERDGSVYFKVSSDAGYGRLAKIDAGALRANAGGRIKNDEYEKDNIQDFALWKAWSKEDGEVFWLTPFGKGRPGWHIECSAMSMANLGESFDIHTSGVDNIFPHHENEIAQSEGATGKQFVKYWMHNEHLLSEGKKMAKSAGNFYTLRDIIERGINPLAFRYWLLTAHYRAPINFNWEALEGAQSALKRLQEMFLNWENETGGRINTAYREKFDSFISDDLDTPRALALLWNMARDETLAPAEKKATILDFDRVLGLEFEEIKPTGIPKEIKDLLAEREEARNKNNWPKADQIRNKIAELGYQIRDTEEGPKIYRR